MKRFNYYWAGFAVLAFTSVICIFQVDSYKADLLHLNALWIAGSVACAVGAIYCIKKV